MAWKEVGEVGRSWLTQASGKEVVLYPKSHSYS